jgi:exodeoxyribonuclease VII small subunit
MTHPQQPRPQTADPQSLAADPQSLAADPQAQPETYEAAAARVEEVIRRLDSGEASLNETLELVREGKALIELCARELSAVGDALEELRLDELVSRLESEAAPSAGT